MMRLVNWVQRIFRGSRFRRKVLLASLAALVYRVWLNRNKVVWDGTCETPSFSVQQVIDSVKLRMQGIAPKHIPVVDRI